MEWRESEASQAALKLAIEQVLRLIYEEHYEVPFISSYRKEVCTSCKLSLYTFLPMCCHVLTAWCVYALQSVAQCSVFVRCNNLHRLL